MEERKIKKRKIIAITTQGSFSCQKLVEKLEELDVTLDSQRLQEPQRLSYEYFLLEKDEGVYSLSLIKTLIGGLEADPRCHERIRTVEELNESDISWLDELIN